MARGRWQSGVDAMPSVARLPGDSVLAWLVIGGGWRHSMKHSLHEETLLEWPMLLTILQVYVHLDRNASKDVTLSALDEA